MLRSVAAQFLKEIIFCIHNVVKMAEGQIAGREDDKTLVYDECPKEEY